MRRSCFGWLIFSAALVGWGGLKAEARSLSDQLNFLFGDRGIELTEVGTPVPHDAHFTSDSLATLGLVVKQLAPAAADFPAISTTPGFTYRYEPSLRVFVPSSASLGSVFVERPQTLGRGKFDFGFSYLHVNFDELNGKDLDRLQFTNLAHNDCCTPDNLPSPGDPAFENDTADLFFEEFNLRSHVVSFFATYGVTDRWDINFLLPVVFTDLKVRARAVINNDSNTHFFDETLSQTTQVRSFDDDKAGVGDLLLRTKYNLLDRENVNLAAGLTLRLPTGDEDNFQGLGDTTVMPFFALSFEYERLDFHTSNGIEINADDTDRSRVRYGGGVTFQLHEQIALFVDVIGSSSIATDRLSVTINQFVNSPGASDTPPSENPSANLADTRTFTEKVKKTDIVDVSVGLKANVYGSVVGFAGALVPLNNDGLRADFIPSAGLEVSF